MVIDENSYEGWRTWLKPGDRLWQFPWGRYFFHYFYPDAVSEQILAYWSSLNSLDSALLYPKPTPIL